MTQKTADVVLTVRFEDGKMIKMTTAQVNALKDRRKYDILDPKGKVVFKKSFRGL